MSHSITILNTRSILLCSIVILLMSASIASYAQPKKTYEIGIFPHLSKSHLENTYQSIIDDLSEATDKPIHFDADENIANFHFKLKNQHYDVVMVQPFDYIEIERKFGYIPLASQNKPLRALIVAKKGGAIQTIQNLLGRKLLLPPDSTAVTYLTKKHFHDFGFNIFNDLIIRYERTHIACLQKLLLSFTDACATPQGALDYFERRMEVKFQVISQTLEIPHTLFAVHPRVPQSHHAKLTNALIKWSDTPAGKKVLANKKIVPFNKIDDKAYDIVRSIKKEVDGY